MINSVRMSTVLSGGRYVRAILCNNVLNHLELSSTYRERNVGVVEPS